MAGEQLGRNQWIEVKPDGASTWTEIGDETRDFSYEDSADELDVTTRGDTAKVYADGFSDISATLSGLFLEEDTPYWDLLPQGGTGEIRWGNGAKVTGAPMESSTYKVTGRSKNMGYEDANSGEISMRLNSAIVDGTYPAP